MVGKGSCLLSRNHVVFFIASGLKSEGGRKEAWPHTPRQLSLCLRRLRQIDKQVRRDRTKRKHSGCRKPGDILADSRASTKAIMHTVKETDRQSYTSQD